MNFQGGRLGGRNPCWRITRRLRCEEEGETSISARLYVGRRVTYISLVLSGLQPPLLPLTPGFWGRGVAPVLWSIGVPVPGDGTHHIALLYSADT